MTKLVHWQEADFDVRVMRPSKWGNPFEVGRHGTRKVCIVKYAAWIPDELIMQLHEIRDKTIACCCVGIKERCHGEILVKLADEGSSWLSDWRRSKSGYDALIKMLDGSRQGSPTMQTC